MRGAAASLLVGATLAAALVAGPARADRIRQPTVVFAGLDKITGRIISFEVAIDETVQFGSLEITPRVCYSRPPTEAPRTDVFVEVDEVTEKRTFNRLFTGWMFASSPGLHGIEHPVYDIWLTDCKGSTQIIPSPPDEAAAPDAGPPDAEPGANPAGDTKTPPPPRKRKQAAAPVDAPPLRAAPDPSVVTLPSQRGGVARRFFPTDDPPIPPANVGQ
ncbi:MAG: DUF2155 domain-containing protein [Roseiarcus sp.]